MFFVFKARWIKILADDMKVDMAIWEGKKLTIKSIKDCG